MIFKIAMYGSFKTTAGYTWLNPNNLDIRKFEDISNHLSNKPSDGRLIQKDDLLGGFLIDKTNGCFCAFRFVDGGRDALGRAGVVITNWAFARYSDVCGKNIRALFDALNFKELPSSNEISLSVSFDFNQTKTLAEGVLNGNEVDCIFKLPDHINQNILVHFTINSLSKKATVKKYSPSKTESPSPKLKTPTINHRLRAKDKSDPWSIFISRRFLSYVFAFLILISAVFLLSPLNKKDLPISEGNRQLSQQTEKVKNKPILDIRKDNKSKDGDLFIDSLAVYVLGNDDFSWYTYNRSGQSELRLFPGTHSDDYGDIFVTFSAKKRKPTLSFSHPISISCEDNIFLFASTDNDNPNFFKFVLSKKEMSESFEPYLLDELRDFYSFQTDKSHPPLIRVLFHRNSIELVYDPSVPVISNNNYSNTLLQCEVISAPVPVIVVYSYKRPYDL